MLDKFSAAASPIWVVTSYFNPSKYLQRYRNFQVFRRFLNVPLLVVELDRKGAFQLTPEDGDIVLQLTGEDRIWQKERLLNLGIKNLPEHVKYVVWADCDVVFNTDDWAARAVRLFESGVNVIQPFQSVSHLTSAWRTPHELWLEPRQQDILLTELSFCKWLENEPFSNERLKPQRRRNGVAPGVAWGARRSILEKLSIYDANVMGGGDRAFCYAVFGLARELQNSIVAKTEAGADEPWLTHAHATHYLEWAKHVDQLVDRKVSYLPNRIFHLWHGDLVNRSYDDRHTRLTSYDFDPKKDLMISECGAWEWRNPNGRMAQDVAAYFGTRLEDG